jgi:Fe-S-cluster containining protein
VTLAPRVRALSIHADYCCRDTGACCASGWDIPVEPEPEKSIRRALLAGTLRPFERGERGAPGPSIEHAFRTVPGLPHGAQVVLAPEVSGRCVFLEGAGGRSRCAVHHRLGEGALPSACRQFPRVVTLTPLGVSVTLSHYCPTAASLLFRHVIPRDSDSPGPEGSAGPPGPHLRVVEDPPAFPPSWPWEGLDARDALPPFLRPGVLMTWPGLERWERFAVSVLGEEGRSPEEALGALTDAAERARRWTPERGEFEGHFERALERPLERALAPGVEREGQAFHGALRNGSRNTRDPARWGSRAWHLLASCIPDRALLPPVPEGLETADTRWVAPAWPALGRPIRFWLATKAFASWLVLQGEGLRTAVLGLRVALGVLRAEAARGCAEAGRTLDAELLKEAVRRADLLLVHLADPEALARRLARRESGERPSRGRRATIPYSSRQQRTRSQA